MPTPLTSIKATARGFEILLMPYDVMKHMATHQKLAQGDTSTDYGNDSIFLTIEIAGQEEVEQGKERSSFCITFPANKSSVGRLKYTELHKSVVYYRCGDGEENASVWLLSTSLPKFELKSKAANSPWRVIKPRAGADTPERRDALYMRCPKGRQINADFFAKCELGNLRCGNLAPGLQFRDSFDPVGKLRRGVVANDFLIRIDSETLLKILRDPNRKPKQDDKTPPPEPNPDNVPEQSGVPDPPVRPESHGEEVPTAVNFLIASPDSKISVPAAPMSETGPRPGTPASEFHILDDPCPGQLILLSASSIVEPNITSYESLIDVGVDFVDSGQFERKSWVDILFNEMLSEKVVEKKLVSRSSYWLDILKEEFHEGQI
ncbi:uncharacterized protein DFL_008102 [Arthrobotrys flagrans]|uniref:Uncharacterized protein n=1 Tax=Arthrobotrys flagrans TaxID=97331 RepID=A0A436ZMS4_ARTFL|nr:hypothetical protein DFL_008102 [Arthrobotrys flagrans]